jgi:hypothetical protein
VYENVELLDSAEALIADIEAELEREYRESSKHVEKRAPRLDRKRQRKF